MGWIQRIYFCWKKKKTFVNFKLLLRAAQYLREKTLRHSKAKN